MAVGAKYHISVEICAANPMIITPSLFKKYFKYFDNSPGMMAILFWGNKELGKCLPFGEK
jgi:hypothetical protein